MMFAKQIFQILHNNKYSRTVIITNDSTKQLDALYISESCHIPSFLLFLSVVLKISNLYLQENLVDGSDDVNESDFSLASTLDDKVNPIFWARGEPNGNRVYEDCMDVKQGFRKLCNDEC